MPQFAWRRGGDLLWEARTAQPPWTVPMAWPCTSPSDPSLWPQRGQCRTGGSFFAESVQLGKGLIQGPQSCPHKLREAGGHRQAGGTPGRCLGQRGPGQQCRSQARGERPPPQHTGAKAMPHASERPAQKKAGRWVRKDLTTLGPLKYSLPGEALGSAGKGEE